MKNPSHQTIRMEIASRFEMLELVHTVLAYLLAQAGFDDDAAHYISVAVRESVVNAIKHGNREDEGKRVSLEFTMAAATFEVRVEDEGGGFDPQEVPNPLDQENLLKTGGRGIFFMRSFMDEVSYSFPARGGTVVRMIKRTTRAAAPSPEHPS